MKAITRALLTTTVGICMLAATTAQADVWYFDYPINDAQNNPHTGSQAAGWAHLAYDDVTNKLDCDMYFEGILKADLIASHVHQGRWGYYGGVVVLLGMGAEFQEEGNGLRLTVTGLDVPPEFNADMVTDGTYIAVHTQQFPAGEIRGQIIASPRLSTTALSRGQQATFSVTRAQAGDRAYFLYSMAGLGDGPVIGALGGLKLDILAPVMLGTANVNQSGQASLTVGIPANAPPFPVFLQVAVRRGVNGADSVKSNTVSTAILP